MISNEHKKALNVIMQKLADQDITWSFSMSTSLALQGVQIKPNDIDILTDSSGAIKIGELLKEYEIKPVEYSASDQFKSYFGIFEIQGIKVEIIGDLQIKKEENNWNERLNVNERERIVLEFEGSKIPLCSLSELYKDYLLMKRFSKAEKINEILSQRNPQNS